MRRKTLGVCALGLLTAAAVMYVYLPSEVAVISACLRVGTVLGVLWLALPDVRNLKNGMLLAGILITVVVFLLAPRLLKFVLPVLGVLAILAYFKPRAGKPPSSKQPTNLSQAAQ